MAAAWWRRLVAGSMAAFAAVGTPAQEGVTPTSITLGTTAPFSGALREWGEEYQRGAEAYLRYVNASGGVHGRQIRVDYMDDAYDAARTVANVRKMDERGVFALINLVGTTNTEALLPHLDRLKLPVIGTASGSHTVRAPAVRSHYLFHTRAGYAEETEKIVEHLVTTGVSNIAVVYQNNNLGKAGLASTQAALQRRNLRAVAITAVETDASNIGAALEAIRAVQPAVIVMITAGAVSTQFIRGYLATGAHARFFGLNIIGSKQLVEELGEQVHGVMVSQVVPHPWSGRTAISRQYQRLMAAAGHHALSFVSMEGFVNAKLAAQALHKAGPQPTREKFIAALETANEIDLGGLHLRFTPDDHNGSGKVELTIIGREGRFLQ
jgi:ABC-type branched-subunit amino acid transport system substrate-binding protein